MVEKVGHSKRMQVTRRAWLDDTKPNRRELTPPPDADMPNTRVNTSDDTRPGDTQADADETAPGDDELDALMAEGATDDAPTTTFVASKKTGPLQQDEPDEDELDALLGGTEARLVTTRTRKAPLPFEEESDDDELEALMAAQASNKPDSSSAQRQGDHDFADDEEAMREMW